jgi:hypothetical protein
MLGVQACSQFLDQSIAAMIHPQAKQFSAERISISIDYEAWNSIRLTMQNAVGIGCLI